MMTSGEELPSNVKVIIEDCGYTSVEDIFTYQLKETFNLPKFPIIYMASMLTNIKDGYKFSEASSIKQVAKSTTPMLFIHGDSDTFVPSWMLDKVYDAANVDKEKLLIKGAGHGMSSSADKEKYWNSIKNFINKYIIK